MERNTHRIAGIVLILLSAALIGIIAQRKQSEPGARGLKIDKTANVVEKISAMARLTSACYYEELVAVRRKPNAHVDNKLGNALANLVSARDGLVTDELCIIAKGSVRAGYNLKNLASDAVRTSGDTLIVRLPMPMVLDVQLNPSDCEVYFSDGRWTQEEITALQKEASDKLYVNALSSGILETARESGEKQLRTLLGSLGYATVLFE